MREIASIITSSCFDFIFSTIAIAPPCPHYTESSKDDIDIAAPDPVNPFPKRSEIHLQNQPLAASQQTMCADTVCMLHFNISSKLLWGGMKIIADYIYSYTRKMLRAT